MQIAAAQMTQVTGLPSRQTGCGNPARTLIDVPFAQILTELSMSEPIEHPMPMDAVPGDDDKGLVDPESVAGLDVVDADEQQLAVAGMFAIEKAPVNALVPHSIPQTGRVPTTLVSMTDTELSDVPIDETVFRQITDRPKGNAAAVTPSAILTETGQLIPPRLQDMTLSQKDLGQVFDGHAPVKGAQDNAPMTTLPMPAPLSAQTVTGIPLSVAPRIPVPDNRLPYETHGNRERFWGQPPDVTKIGSRIDPQTSGAVPAHSALAMSMIAAPALADGIVALPSAENAAPIRVDAGASLPIGDPQTLPIGTYDTDLTQRTERASLTADAIARQIAVTVRQTSDQTMELILSPAELGRVRMTLTPQDQGLAVVLMIDRPETAELMRRHADMLEHELRSLGYAAVTLSFGGGASAGDDTAGSRHSVPDDEMRASEMTLQQTDQEPGPQLDRTALHGGLDLRL
ncbi:flagellar hook-length control protein FliK [Loktanella sp. SALINAS62]|uniref:flagellar hook-length control protein FliK n=1 Tax=Loktanella sp. SALINAS62 TaxID=2706124 RepID=UPI001B8C0214|nr:flagellar hook-length control protein FliK [Loktanella sp. SALINAS62]MBS1301872.1 hypothetical protein [Loktanella sp. SALINAS62]